MYGPEHGALSEGELGPRLQQRRQGSGVVGIALQRLVELWRHMLAHCAFLTGTPLYIPLPAAASAGPLPAPLGGAGAGRGWLNGTLPHRGRRHICPPAGCERGGGVVQRPLSRSERQLNR